jgi:hypothetical protein
MLLGVDGSPNNDPAVGFAFRVVSHRRTEALSAVLAKGRPGDF